jgi:histidyl-tRNA synthetase
VRDLGGPDVPAIGFAIGMERLILLLQQEHGEEARAPRVFSAAASRKRPGGRNGLRGPQPQGPDAPRRQIRRKLCPHPRRR